MRLSAPAQLSRRNGVRHQVYPGLVSYLRFGLVALNTLAFIGLLFASLRFYRLETSQRVRRLWLVVALAGAALVVGSLQRLVLQAGALGWISPPSQSSVIEDWQLVQSLVVAALAVGGFLIVKGLARSIAASERIAGSILDRVSHVDPTELELTQREQEVLATIGSGLVTDSDLSTALHISPSTVQTHVKSLLRKTGLNRRQDLIGVAYLVEAEGGKR